MIIFNCKILFKHYFFYFFFSKKIVLAEDTIGTSNIFRTRKNHDKMNW